MPKLTYGTGRLSGSTQTTETKKQRDPRPLKQAHDEIFDLLNGNIDHENLADDAVTLAGGEMANSAVETAKFQAGAVTTAKITNIGGQKMHNEHLAYYEEEVLLAKGDDEAEIGHGLETESPHVTVQVLSGTPHPSQPEAGLYWIEYVDENTVALHGRGDPTANLRVKVRVI